MKEPAKIELVKRSLWDRKRTRLGLFLGTYVAVSLITLVLFPSFSFVAAIRDPWLCGLGLCGLALLVVPSGFMQPFMKNSRFSLDAQVITWNFGLWLFAILILLSISLLAILLPSRRVFQVLYIIFVILMILGAIGNLLSH